MLPGAVQAARLTYEQKQQAIGEERAEAKRKAEEQERDREAAVRTPTPACSNSHVSDVLSVFLPSSRRSASDGLSRTPS